MPQGDIQASVRSYTGTTGTYEGDFHALFDQNGIQAGAFNGRLLAWLNLVMGTSYDEINGAKWAFAQYQGAVDWSGLATFTLGFPGSFGDYNFLTGRYFGRSLSCARASTGYVIDKTGLYASVAANTMRIGYYPDPNGIERRNFIRNNTMVGAQAADGVELVQDSTFASGLGAGIANPAGTGTVAWDGANQRVALTGDGTNTSNFIVPFPTVVGRTYTLIYNTSGQAATGVNLGTSAGGSQYSSLGGSVGQRIFQFTATTTTTYLAFFRTPATTVFIEDVSVQWAGALPTRLFAPGANGLATKVIGTPVIEGNEYVDLEIFGTATAASNLEIDFGANGDTPAAAGQFWAGSVYFEEILADPSVPGTALQLTYINAAGNAETATRTQITMGRTRARNVVLSPQTVVGTGTGLGNIRLNTACTGTIASGTTIRWQVRFGVPQLELSPYATNVIKTSGSAVSVVGGDPTWNKIRNSVGAGAAPASPTSGIGRYFTGLTGITIRLSGQAPIR
jgi:hypothetical protein